MTDDLMCATWCNACSTGDKDACQGVMNEPQCRRSCPAWLRNLGTLEGMSGRGSDTPLQKALDSFVRGEKGDTGETRRDTGDETRERRDRRALRAVGARGRGRETMVPSVPGFMNRRDAWGGGLRRMVLGGTGPRREDAHYHAPRYVPIGFARYQSPVVNPADYQFYRISGWRVAVSRATPGVRVRDLLMRIYRYGPESAGYARLGDTLVPAILSPGDRKTLVGTATTYGNW